jgi:hypothetical protein
MRGSKAKWPATRGRGKDSLLAEAICEGSEGRPFHWLWQTLGFTPVMRNPPKRRAEPGRIFSGDRVRLWSLCSQALASGAVRRRCRTVLPTAERLAGYRAVSLREAVSFAALFSSRGGSVVFRSVKDQARTLANLRRSGEELPETAEAFLRIAAEKLRRGGRRGLLAKLFCWPAPRFLRLTHSLESDIIPPDVHIWW